MTYKASKVKILYVYGEPIVGNVAEVEFVFSYEYSREPKPGDFIEGTGMWNNQPVQLRSVIFKYPDGRFWCSAIKPVIVKLSESILSKIQRTTI